MQVLLEVRAGRCVYNGGIVTPQPEKGLLQLTKSLEDELTHLLWRPRTPPNTQALIDLIIFPGEAIFKKIVPQHQTTSQSQTPTREGEIFLLEIASTKEKQFFWSQEPYQEKSEIFFQQICRELQISPATETLSQHSETQPTAQIPAVTQTQPQTQTASQPSQGSVQAISQSAPLSGPFSASALENIIKSLASGSSPSGLQIASLFVNVEQQPQLREFFLNKRVQQELIRNLPDSEREKNQELLDSCRSFEDGQGSMAVAQHLMDFVQSAQFIQSADYLSLVLNENSNIQHLLAQFDVRNVQNTHQIIGVDGFLKALIDSYKK